MSYLARKLCDEIVEPALKQSSTDTTVASQRCSKKSGVKVNNKVTRSVIVEKKKVINKLLPHEASKSKSIVKEFESKEILLNKKLIDIAVNTLVTGPLRCNNDCNTMVRKRDSCMCSRKKGNCKLLVKGTQTFCTKDYSYIDKASAQCVETVNCGTQPFVNNNAISNNANSSVLHNISNGEMRYIKSTKTRPDTHTRRNVMDVSSSLNTRSLNFDTLSPKRWALNKYPTRGPDF